MKAINVAVVGMGKRGEIDAANFAGSADFNLVAVCDEAEEKKERARSKFGNGLRYESDYRVLLADSEIEAVAIASPQFTHREIAVAAFEHGKHVYCEKPLALSLSDCDTMIEAGRKANRVFLVGQQMRYHFHLHKMAGLIESGEIGRPVMAWLREFRNPFPLSMGWVWDKNRSGGMLVEKSCHHFDVFCWMIGSRPKSVFASGGADVFPDPLGLGHALEDNAYVTVDYENGARALLQLCMFAGEPHNDEGGIGHHVREIGVVGEKGMLRTEGFDLGKCVELRPNNSRDVTRFEVSTERRVAGKFNQSGNRGILMDFAECIRGSQKPFASAEIGKTAVAIGLAAEESMASGRVVNIGEN